MMLWMNLRRALKRPRLLHKGAASGPSNTDDTGGISNSNASLTNAPKDKADDDNVIFVFPYGSKECVVSKGQTREKIVQIRSRPSGRYGMFRDLWGLRLASFGTIDRSGGHPFEQSTVPGGRDAVPNSRIMSDSLIQVTLPFRENKELFGDYVNIYGGIRFGKVMEDLDVFAATCAYMHCGTSTTSGEKLAIVTAAVDRIDMHMRLDEPLNLRMKGMVTFVGRSSMEVTILIESSTGPIDTGTDASANTDAPQVRASRDPTIEQLASTFSADDSAAANELWKPAAVAKFIMVARDASGPIEVPRLRLTSEREEAIFSAGEQRNRARLERAQQSLFKEPPTAAESVLLHRLFLSSTSSTSASQALSIAATALTTTKLCHPQERNIHNLIFGGYLMREAFELGYTCAQMFARAGELQFLAVDELAFKHPVPIGALLQLSAHVVYTQEEEPNSSATDLAHCAQQTVCIGQMIHVEVVADVVNITSHDRKTTNTFHFTFRLDPTAPHHPGSLRTVRPSTYVEAMRYLEGKRRLSAARLDPNSQIFKF